MQSFFYAHLELCKHLIHRILQRFIEGQKFVRGDRLGTAFLQRNWEGDKGCAIKLNNCLLFSFGRQKIFISSDTTVQ